MNDQLLVDSLSQIDELKEKITHQEAVMDHYPHSEILQNACRSLIEKYEAEITLLEATLVIECCKINICEIWLAIAEA